MAKGFNLTAEINLRGPSNVKTVIADIRRQLGTIDTSVTVKIDPQAANNANKLSNVLTKLNSVLTTTSTQSRLTAANITQLANALGSFQTSANAATRSLSGLPRNIAQTTQGIQKAAQQTAAARTELEEFGRQSALAVRRFAAFSLATGAIYSLVNAVSKGTKEFIEFDRQIVRLTQITGESYEQLGTLAKTVTGLSTSLGVASSDLIGIADTLAQAGLNAKQTEQALKALALTALAPSFDQLSDTVEGAIALMRQFTISTGDLEKALSSINSVAAAFAVESSDLIAAIQRTGGVFASASRGVSEGTDALNEFLAIFTSVRATTRESAETIATGLRTIFTRIQRSDTIEALKDYGVTLTDVEGKFVGAYRAVELLAQGLGRLDPRDLKFSQIVEELGGFRQIGKVLPLIQQFSTAQEALKVAYEGQGSLATDALKAQAALSNQFAKTRENFLALIRDIGNSDSFQSLVNVGLTLANTFIKVASVAKPLLPILTSIAAVKGSEALFQFGSGFIGGFNKQSSSSVGQNAGQVLSGARNQQSATAAVNNARALSSNTSAIQSLTSAVQQLINTINSRTSGGGPQTINAGGIVKAFARGGMVPGVGNSDTVPAMLQPGEFVIRKKAVETIGASNLYNMNKYGNGGDVTSSRLARKRMKYASGGPVSVEFLKEINPNSVQPDYRSLEEAKSKVGEQDDSWSKYRADGRIGRPRPTAVKYMQPQDEVYGKVQYIPVQDPDRSEIEKYWGGITFQKGTRSINPKDKRISDAYENYINDKLKGITGIRYTGEYDPLDFEEGDAKFYSSEANIQKYASVDKVLSKRLRHENKNLKINWKPDTPEKRELPPTYIYHPTNLSENGSLKQKLTDWLLLNQSQRTFQAIREGNAFNSGGEIEKFAKGGIAGLKQVTSRRVGIIDTDVLRDPANKEVVSSEMQKLGLTDTSQYTLELAKRATAARKEGSLLRLRAIAGAAGSGKSSLATGLGATDDARLRKTTRSQILTPKDISDIDEVLVLTSTASDSKLDAYLRNVDRAYVLSSSSAEERQQIENNRERRDSTGQGLYGRKPGTTRGATTDFSLDETILRDELGSRAMVLGRKTGSYGLRRKRENELPEIVQAGGFYTGGFAPPTRGHRGALNSLLARMIKQNPNAAIEDILVSVAPDLPMIEGSEGIEHSARYGIFPSDFRALLSQINFGGAMISTQNQPPGGLPKFMEVGGTEGRRRFARLKGAMAVTSGKEEGVLGKYERAGIQVEDIPRIEDISATKVRDALFAGDDKLIQEYLDPRIASVVMGNRTQLRNRSMMVPMLLEKIKEVVEVEKANYNAEATSLLASAPGGPYKNVSAKLRENAPEIVEQIKEIRLQRDNLARGAFGYRAYNVIQALSSQYPELYGLDPNRQASVSTASQDIDKEIMLGQIMAGMSDSFPSASNQPQLSPIQESILARVQKETSSRGSGLLPASNQEILKTLGDSVIPNDDKFGKFAGKSLYDHLKLGKKAKTNLPYWFSDYKTFMRRPGEITGLTEADVATYSATRDYVISLFNQQKSGEQQSLLNDTTQQIAQTQMLAIVGLKGKNGLQGPLTWNLGNNASGEPVSISTTIMERVLPAKYKAVADYISEQTGNVVQTAANMITGQSSAQGLDARKREVLNQGNIEGGILEQLLATLGAGVLDDAVRTRAIDFPSGIGETAAKVFGIDPNIPTEAKRTIDSTSRAKAIEEFQRYFRGVYNISEPEIVQAFKLGGEVYSLQKATGLNNSEFDEIKRFADSNNYNLEEFKEYLSLRVAQKRDRSNLVTNSNSLLNSLIPQSTQSTQKQIDLANMLKGPVDAKYNPRYDRAIKKFANGGSSEDTVPALLTPGEFVINKKAAEKIGYAKLKKLNNADKLQGFNKGGIVGGGVQKFNTGGTVASDAQLRAISDEMTKALMLLPDAIRDLVEKTFKSNPPKIGDSFDDINLKMRQQMVAAQRDVQNLGSEVVEGVRKVLGAGVKTLNKIESDALLSGTSTSRPAASPTTNTLPSGLNYNPLLRTIRRNTRENDPDIQAKYQQVASARFNKSIEQVGNRALALGAALAVPLEALSRFTGSTTVAGQVLTSLSNSAGNVSATFYQAVQSIRAFANFADSQLGKKILGQLSQSLGTVGLGKFINQRQALLGNNSLGSFGISLGAGAAAAVVLTKAFVDYSNALKQSRIEQAQKKQEESLVKSAEALEEYAKNQERASLVLANAFSTVASKAALDEVNARQSGDRKLGAQTGATIGVGALAGGAIGTVLGFGPVGTAIGVAIGGTVAGALAQYLNFDRQRGTTAEESSRLLANPRSRMFDVYGERFRAGETSRDIISSPEWAIQSELLARANAETEALIRSVEASRVLTEEQKKARIEEIIQIEASSQLRQQEQIWLKQKGLIDLDNATKAYSRSLKNMFANMDEAINKSSLALENFNTSIDLAESSLKGQARIGIFKSETINTIRNPRASDEQERSRAAGVAGSFFGSEGSTVTELLNVGTKIESAVLAAIQTAQTLPGSTTDEAIAAAVRKSVRNELTNSSLPQELSDKLGQQIAIELEKRRKSGDDKIDFRELEEAIPQLRESVEALKGAQDIAIKALENYTQKVGLFIDKTNSAVELLIQAGDLLRKASEIRFSASSQLDRVFGSSIDVNSIQNFRNSSIRSQTGGAVTPRDILDNINKLENRRAFQQNQLQNATERGRSGTRDVIGFTEELSRTTKSLRDNQRALEDLATNSELASAALEKMSELQAKTQAGQNIIERYVTSTREDNFKLSSAFERLENNMAGITNDPFASRNVMEAMMNSDNPFLAADQAAAQDRRDTLEAFNMLAPFLGDSREQNTIKANVLETMLQEAGIGMTPMFNEVINSLRNPENNSEMSQLVDQYKESIKIQAQANELLAELNVNFAQNLKQSSEEAFKNAITDTLLDFERAQVEHLQKIEEILSKQTAATGRAQGGIVYKDGGGSIFKPQGTDTVPAMLTPGEFVVNKASTQKYGSVLKAINSNKYSSGGPVNYYSRGGYVSKVLRQDESGFVRDSSKDITDSFGLGAEYYENPAENKFFTKNKHYDPRVVEALLRGPGSKIFLHTIENDPNLIPMGLDPVSPQNYSVSGYWYSDSYNKLFKKFISEGVTATSLGLGFYPSYQFSTSKADTVFGIDAPESVETAEVGRRGGIPKDLLEKDSNSFLKKRYIRFNGGLLAQVRSLNNEIKTITDPIQLNEYDVYNQQKFINKMSKQTSLWGRDGKNISDGADGINAVMDGFKYSTKFVEGGKRPVFLSESSDITTPADTMITGLSRFTSDGISVNNNQITTGSVDYARRGAGGFGVQDGSKSRYSNRVSMIRPDLIYQTNSNDIADNIQNLFMLQEDLTNLENEIANNGFTTDTIYSNQYKIYQESLYDLSKGLIEKAKFNKSILKQEELEKLSSIKGSKIDVSKLTNLYVWSKRAFDSSRVKTNPRFKNATNIGADFPIEDKATSKTDNFVWSLSDAISGSDFLNSIKPYLDPKKYLINETFSETFDAPWAIDKKINVEFPYKTLKKLPIFDFDSESIGEEYDGFGLYADTFAREGNNKSLNPFKLASFDDDTQLILAKKEAAAVLSDKIKSWINSNGTEVPEKAIDLTGLDRLTQLKSSDLDIIPEDNDLSRETVASRRDILGGTNNIYQQLASIGVLYSKSKDKVDFDKLDLDPSMIENFRNKRDLDKAFEAASVNESFPAFATGFLNIKKQLVKSKESLLEDFISQSNISNLNLSDLAPWTKNVQDSRIGDLFSAGSEVPNNLRQVYMQTLGWDKTQRTADLMNATEDRYPGGFQELMSLLQLGFYVNGGKTAAASKTLANEFKNLQKGFFGTQNLEDLSVFEDSKVAGKKGKQWWKNNGPDWDGFARYNLSIIARKEMLSNIRSILNKASQASFNQQDANNLSEGIETLSIGADGKSVVGAENPANNLLELINKTLDTTKIYTEGYRLDVAGAIQKFNMPGGEIDGDLETIKWMLDPSSDLLSYLNFKDAILSKPVSNVEGVKVEGEDRDIRAPRLSNYALDSENIDGSNPWLVYQKFLDNAVFSNVLASFKELTNLTGLSDRFVLQNPNTIYQGPANTFDGKKYANEDYRSADPITGTGAYVTSYKALAGTTYSTLFDKAKKEEALADSVKENRNVIYRSRGGPVGYYSSGGSIINFQPKGTDTVPAMLTPGEFVVNRAATQKNLPLLQSINNSNSSPNTTGYFRNGGKVGAPEFDLGTTTEYRPENSFGNRSISTLSRVQYESRYGVPGVRDNIKMISDGLYEILKNKSSEESRFRKEGTPLLYSTDETRSKIKKANELKLNKQEYTQLSIGETERFVPLFKRDTQEYYPNGADFDHSVFDQTMLDFKDLPTINYLNVDIRSNKQKMEAIRQAVGERQGVPDLLAKHLLGLKEYESTWASIGLSMILDLDNVIPGELLDEPLKITAKSLTQLSKKTSIAKGMNKAIDQGKTGLGSLNKKGFAQKIEGFTDIPSEVLGLASPPPNKVPKPPSGIKAGVAGRVSIDESMLNAFLKNVPTKVSDFKKSFDNVVSTDNVYKNITDFIRFIGLPDDKALLAAPMVVDIRKINANVAGQFYENAGRLGTQGVKGSAATGRGLLELQPYTEMNVMYHELVHQLLSGLRKKHPASWKKYQEHVKTLFESGSGKKNSLAKAFESLQGGYNSIDVVYGAYYKTRKVEDLLKANPLNTELYNLLQKMKGSRGSMEGWAAIDNQVIESIKKFGYTDTYIKNLENAGLEEFLTTMVERAGSLDVNMRNILGSTLDEVFSASGIQRNTSLFQDFYADVSKPTIFEKIKTGIRSFISPTITPPTVPKKTPPTVPKKTPKNKALGATAVGAGAAAAAALLSQNRNSNTSSSSLPSKQRNSSPSKQIPNNIPTLPLPLPGSNPARTTAQTQKQTQKLPETEVKTVSPPPVVKLPEIKASSNKEFEPKNISTAQNSVNTRDFSNYYDELTYKEFINATIQANSPKRRGYTYATTGPMPVPPEDERFTTPAFYVKNDETGERYRITAYDKRDTSGKTEKTTKYSPIINSIAPDGRIKLGKEITQTLGENEKVWGSTSIITQLASAINFFKNRRGEHNVGRSLDARLPNRYNNGGIVYASDGALINFQPMGTDTVPAMLTPGEFVVNRRATQQNLPLLKQINSQNYQRGGVVQYYQTGTQNPVQQTGGFGGMYSLALDDKSISLIREFTSKFTEFSNKLANLAIPSLKIDETSLTSLNNFTQRFDNFTKELLKLNIPPVITITGKHDVNVNINGASVFSNMDKYVSNMIKNEINNAFAQLARETDGAITMNYNPSAYSNQNSQNMA